MTYRGPAGHNSLHSHATLQLTTSDSEPLLIKDSSGLIYTGRDLFIRPGVRHSLVMSSEVTLILVEPQSRIAKYILSLCSDDEMGNIPKEISTLLRQNATSSELAYAIENMDTSSQESLDVRLDRALSFLRRAPLKNAIRNAANDCHLSESRLRALAHKHLGIPLSNWLLWCAITRAGEAISSGETLAEAAVSGGFADQAHYTRTLNRLMGITPGQIQHLLRQRQAFGSIQ